MNFKERKAKIFEALLARDGIQNLINVASEAIENPIFVLDISYKILACSNCHESETKIWKELFPEGHSTAADHHEAEKAGVLEKVYSNDAPVFGKFSFCPYRFLGARIRDKSNVVGYVLVLEYYRDISEEDQELLITICKAALFEMLYQGQRTMHLVKYNGLFGDLLEKNISESEMNERIAILHLHFAPFLRLLSIGHVDSESGLSLYYTRDQLNQLFYGSYSVIYCDRILMILDNENWNEETIAKLKSYFAEKRIRIGVSRRFDSLLNLRPAFEQASEAVTIYRRLDMDNLVCEYDEIYLYHFFYTASQKCDVHAFCSPLLERFQKYDDLNGTKFNKTVEVYLECGRNIQKAADALFLHKNTMYYRLHKIEELFEIDLSDENVCFALQFSYRLLRIIK